MWRLFSKLTTPNIHTTHCMKVRTGRSVYFTSRSIKLSHLSGSVSALFALTVTHIFGRQFRLHFLDQEMLHTVSGGAVIANESLFVSRITHSGCLMCSSSTNTFMNVQLHVLHSWESPCWIDLFTPEKELRTQAAVTRFGQEGTLLHSRKINEQIYQTGLFWTNKKIVMLICIINIILIQLISPFFLTQNGRVQ